MVDVEKSLGLCLDAVEEACDLVVSVQSVADLNGGQQG